jgi:protein-tyrosine-phosphatase
VNRFSLVFVCSGNRFRSPLAEAFVHRLTVGLPVDVQSFGTLPLGSVPALPEAVELAFWCGIDLGPHRARLVGQVPLAGAEAVLGFEQQHVRRAVVDAGAPRERSFTFRELVLLLHDVEEVDAETPLDRARQLVERASERRERPVGLVPREEIPDPFGRSWRVYRETAEETRSLSLRLVERLFGVRDTRTLPPFPPNVPRRRFRLLRR